jgi:hypothetical protein
MTERANLHMKYADRRPFWHRNWGPPESCDECMGRGLVHGCAEHDRIHGLGCETNPEECWYDEKFYCKCELGQDRQREESRS